MTPAPILHTERLTLRPHRREDFDACCRLWTDSIVTRFMGGRPSTPEEVWSRLLRYAGSWPLLGFGYWAIIETASGHFVGEAGLADFHRDITPAIADTPEAGWALLSRFHGQGMAREALTAILAWSDGAGLGRTVCMIDPANIASIRLATAAGYHEYARTLYRDGTTMLFAREPNAG